VAILVRGKGEIWCVYLPDFDGCHTEQSRLHVVLACAEVPLPYGHPTAGRSIARALLLCPALRRIGDSDIEENATRNTSVAVERSFLSADEK
jgi:hypothetical protein